jgi:hypothetical protein
MKMHLIIRRFAGIFILLSLVLAHYHSQYWLWFTAFVGFNLLQSSFTNFCPLEIILKKCGVGKDAGSCCPGNDCERIAQLRMLQRHKRRSLERGLHPASTPQSQPSPFAAKP